MKLQKNEQIASQQNIYIYHQNVSIEDSSKFETKFELSKQQITLHKELSKINIELANMYYGALYVLNEEENPERICLAAHSIRELLEKFPLQIDEGIEVYKQSLKAKVNELQRNWDKFIKKINNSKRTELYDDFFKSLGIYIREEKDFFNWFEQDFPKRRKIVQDTLQKMDPSGKALPASLVDQNVNSWMEISKFFIDVAHHRIFPTMSTFNEYLDKLEKFLIERILSPILEDIPKIDSIIENGEIDA